MESSDVGRDPVSCDADAGRSLPVVIDPGAIAKKRAASQEVGALLIVSGIAGILLPGPVGTPLLILGCVIIWPKAFEQVDRFFAKRFPWAHQLGVIQSARFLSDLDRRYPVSKCLLIGLALAGSTGCGGDRGGARQRVVVYSSLDREFSEPLLKEYARQASVELLPKFDVESTKTVGLTNLIMTETEHPRCDLFWNNEILNTLRLKEKGLLAPFQPSHADELPATFRAKDETWYGFAARARILLVNTKLVAEADRPAGIKDLLDPRWKGKIGIAKPLFGTTATQAACLFVTWGDDRAKAYFHDLKANGVQVLSGNKQVATAVGSGRLAFGLTDTDDAMGELDAGSPVVIIYPDRKPEDLGTLFIPNTLALIKGSPHPDQAQALASYLLSPDIETALANGPSAQIPLLTTTTARARVETPKTVHAMEADFEAAVKIWDHVAAFLLAEFGGE
jgi:iron(III) transport system substrate-binding protein